MKGDAGRSTVRSKPSLGACLLLGSGHVVVVMMQLWCLLLSVPQAQGPPGGRGAAAPAGDRGEGRDSPRETGQDEREDQNPEREERTGEAAAGYRQDGSAVQVRSVTKFCWTLRHDSDSS